MHSFSGRLGLQSIMPSFLYSHNIDKLNKHTLKRTTARLDVSQALRNVWSLSVFAWELGTAKTALLLHRAVYVNREILNTHNNPKTTSFHIKISITIILNTHYAFVYNKKTLLLYMYTYWRRDSTYCIIENTL